MKIRIKRFDTTLPLPQYKTAGAAAFDCTVRLTTTVEAKSTALVPLNIAIQLPTGHCALLQARSSLPKRGLMIANGVGLIDEDYSGNDDELKAFVYNFTDAPVVIEKGERIVQAMVLPVDRVEWEEQETLNSESRGGFGTTGK
jgi:dUTP pyrophosphatase